jgi:transposase-like protein
VYGFRCRPIWRCKECGRQFSVTSGTLFHSRKLRRLRIFGQRDKLKANRSKGA